MRRIHVFDLWALGLLACAGPDPAVSSPPAAFSGVAPDDADLEPADPTLRATGGVLSGPCEASALAPWDDGWLVADNEDPARLFAFDTRFRPRPAYPLSEEVGDIEALAVQDDGLWVVGSQSTTEDGEIKAKRGHILRPDGALVTLDLSACPRCEEMVGVPPALGGLNIEGAAWGEDRLWLGLRSPLSVAGDALLLVATPDGHVEDVYELDLDGRGIRALAPAWNDGGLLIVAGPSTQGDEPHSVWRLDPREGVPARLDVTLPPSAEGAAFLRGVPATLLYVTDGAGTPEACETPATWGRVEMPR